MKGLKIILLLFCFWTAQPLQLIGQEYVTATAVEGDGIWSLLRKSGIKPTPDAITEFRSINSGALRGRDLLKTGHSYKIPSTVRDYPIFGADHRRVTVLSDRLKGHVYYVVGGHGGPDPGTLGTYKGRLLPEDEIAYDTALRLARNLIQESATVYIIVRDEDDGIRDTDHFENDQDEYYLGGIKISRNQKKRLRDRTEIINRLYDENKNRAKSQQVIAIHVDSYGARIEPQIDVHFMTTSIGGYELGRSLRDTFKAKYARFQPDRIYRGRIENTTSLYVLNNTKPVAVLVELGNIRHPGDQHRLIKSENRQAIADWLRDGFIHDALGTTLTTL